MCRTTAAKTILQTPLIQKIAKRNNGCSVDCVILDLDRQITRQHFKSLPVHKYLLIFLFLSTQFLAGCLTTGSNRSHVKAVEGTAFEVANVAFEEVWGAAISVTQQHLTITEHNRRRGRIKAQTDGKMSALAENVLIVITPAQSRTGPYYVDIFGNKGFIPNRDDKDWENTLASEIKTELNKRAAYEPSYFVEKDIAPVRAIPPVFHEE